MAGCGHLVEKVISRRLKEGKLEYRVKWAGRPSSANAWVTEEQLIGKDELIRLRIRASIPEGISEKHQALQPEEIVGATMRNGQLKLWVKFPGDNNYDLVHHLEANAKWPQLVIKFYEARTYFRG